MNKHLTDDDIDAMRDAIRQHELAKEDAIAQHELAEELLPYIEDAIFGEDLETCAYALSHALNDVLGEFAASNMIGSLLLRQAIIHVMAGSVL